MNPRTKVVRVCKCVLCAYPFADMHHVVPRAFPVTEDCRLPLCPNHHRFANLVQAWVLEGVDDGQIGAFAREHFDADFNAKLLPALLTVRPGTFEADVIWDMLWGREGTLNPSGVRTEATNDPG